MLSSSGYYVGKVFLRLYKLSKTGKYSNTSIGQTGRSQGNKKYLFETQKLQLIMKVVKLRLRKG